MVDHVGAPGSGLEAAMKVHRIEPSIVKQEVEAAGFSVVQSLVGHGVGRSMHEEPQVPNYGRPGTGMRIEAGMCFAIEPMFNLGGDEVYVEDDGWTVRTIGRRGAHGARSAAWDDDDARLLRRQGQRGLGRAPELDRLVG